MPYTTSRLRYQITSYPTTLGSPVERRSIALVDSKKAPHTQNRQSNTATHTSSCQPPQPPSRPDSTRSDHLAYGMREPLNQCVPWMWVRGRSGPSRASMSHSMRHRGWHGSVPTIVRGVLIRVRVVYGIGRVDKRRCSRRADRLIVLLYLCEIRRRMRGRTVRGSASGGCWAVWVFSTNTLLESYASYPV